ncbi:MAG: hypothetical protein VB122_06760 [Erysipelotrichales bacterium]|nr:hypothetical protein [Erysipelotrichales bacterium]
MKPLAQITDDLKANVKFAENQNEYPTLPAHVFPNGVVACTLELTDEEIEEIVKTKKVYLSMLTFNKPLQPFFVTGQQETFKDYLNIYSNH